MFSDGSSFGETFGFGSMEPMPSLMGDFYHEPDDVTRGLSLYSGADDFSYADEFSKHGSFGFFDSNCLLGKGFAEEIGSASSMARCDRFQEADQAFLVPEDAFFQLERTTIVVNGASAAQIGNCLLDFLGVEVDGKITKVNRTKCTIKAEVRVDGLTCMTKLRIYRQGLGQQHVVEMQRRSGDSLAFQRLFRWASDHISSCTNSQFVDQLVEPNLSNGANIEPPSFLRAPFPDHVADSHASVAPLLELVESSDSNQRLQAEAVEGLLLAAQEQPHLAVQLCTPETFLVFQNLLQLMQFSIAEPLCRLLCCLAMVPEADSKFTDQQMLKSMIATVWSNAAGQIASEQMAQVVCKTLVRHSAEFSHEAKDELASALTERLNEGVPSFAVGAPAPSLTTVHYLQESLQKLSLVEHSQMVQAW